MRFMIKAIGVLIVVPATLSLTPAKALPYDPYPWCSFYSDPGN